MSVAELARAIADEIEESGHYQSRWGVPISAVCVITSQGYWGVDMTEKRALKQAIAEKVNEDWVIADNIPAWNDSTDTAEVLEILRSL